MKKRFYTIGSLICAGLLAVFGFGSCKSGKALQAERTRLTTQADSLTRRLSKKRDDARCGTKGTRSTRSAQSGAS